MGKSKKSRGKPGASHQSKLIPSEEKSRSPNGTQPRDRQPTLPSAVEKARKIVLTPKSLGHLRKTLGLSRSDFAGVVGVSAQTVYAWEETRDGPLKLRDKNRMTLLLIQAWERERQSGVHEAKH